MVLDHARLPFAPRQLELIPTEGFEPVTVQFLRLAPPTVGLRRLMKSVGCGGKSCALHVLGSGPSCLPIGDSAKYLSSKILVTPAGFEPAPSAFAEPRTHSAELRVQRRDEG